MPIRLVLHERRRVVEAVVVVGLGRVVDDGVVVGDQLVDESRVGDVAHDQLDPVLGQPGQRLTRGGVRQLVEHRHPGVGVTHQVVDEVGADEAGTTGHEEAIHADTGAAAMADSSQEDTDLG